MQFEDVKMYRTILCLYENKKVKKFLKYSKRYFNLEAMN